MTLDGLARRGGVVAKGTTTEDQGHGHHNFDDPAGNILHKHPSKMGNCGPSKLRETQTQQPQERPHERIKDRSPSVNSSITYASAGVSQGSDEGSLPRVEVHPDLTGISSPGHDKSSNPGHPPVKTTSFDHLVKDCLESGQLRSCTVFHNNVTASFGQRIEDIYDGVRDGEVLGEGFSGVVRRIHHREAGVTRALKRLDLKGLAKNDIDALLGEIKIMCSLDHPNVVCLEEGKSSLLSSYVYHRLGAKSNPV